MKITHSALDLSSTHVQHLQRSEEESLRLWVGDQRPRFDDEEAQSSGVNLRDTISISQEARTLAQSPQPSNEPQYLPEEATEAPLDPHLQTLRLIIEAMTGQKIKVAKLTLENTPANLENPGAAVAEQTTQQQGWGVEYDATETIKEYEKTTLSGRGEVATSDGRHIRIDISSTQERSFSETRETHIRLGDARLVDPLVINLSSSSAALVDQHFSFDLNGDGIEEKIASLKDGSGFLFLDKNEDGTATNGTELFGPSSGNGFSELAALDEDGNGWIDEGDSRFSDIRVWSKKQTGENVYRPLNEYGVGALSLTTIAAPFSLKNQENEVHGIVQDSSLFLRENGSAGTIQELFLTV